jgi:hypothetical protein
MKNPKVTRVLYLCIVLVILPVGFAIAQHSFETTPLKNIIGELRSTTGYTFLYRESQIDGVKLTFTSDSNTVWQTLADQLTVFGIHVKTDHTRKQVVFVGNLVKNSGPVRISGQIVDDISGERLPYATISWKLDSKLDGVVSNASGAYNFIVNPTQNEIRLNVSYVGYTTETVVLATNQSGSITDLTVRLKPNVVQGQEIIINDYLGYNPSDTLFTGMIDAGRFSPLGGSNTIRALQSHPSVMPGSALNQGITIRGSSPDGFLVLLDGMSMFNHSHLFGLMDSFNADAIQSAGYYVGIIPAHIETPTGGTLNLLTRSGSRNSFRSKVGATNTSLDVTVEGPISTKSSWLASARSSYMNNLNWLNNQKLVQWGLDINRPRNIANNDPDYTNLVLRIGETSAKFLDLHGKVYIETTKNGMWSVSSYLGGDETFQYAQRRARSSASDGEFIFIPVESRNKWGNGILSVSYDAFLGPTIFSSTMAGVSVYETAFSKDDFVYSLVINSDSTNSVALFTYPFRNSSSLTEYKINQEFEFHFSKVRVYSGAGLRYYKGRYSEVSFDRPSFQSQMQSMIADSWIQAHLNPVKWLDIHGGSRVYYYSNQKKLFVAPRSEVHLKLDPRFTVTGGYAKAYQFLHRISIQNTTTADVWVLSDQNQPPASATQLTTGFLWNPTNLISVKGDIYKKEFDGLRVHELNTQTLENTFINEPWFSSNEGVSTGMELLVRLKWDRFILSQTITRSKIELKNPFLFNGQAFLADWDRTYSSNSVLESKLSRNGRFYISWISMTGTPGSISVFTNPDRQRLGNYNRLDLSLKWIHQLKSRGVVDWSISLYNALNTDNVWYRNYAFSFDETRLIPRLKAVPVDVLDLGMQPSFTIRYSFE